MQRTQEQVIQEILLHYPPQLRAQARMFLEDTTSTVMSQRPEVSGLMEELASLRLKEHMTRSQSIAASETPAQDRCRVSVALVPGMATGVRAVVIRRPNDKGIPLLLLRDDATAVELEFGLKMAARSLSTFGETATEAHRIEYKGGPPLQPQHLGSRFESGIALVRQAVPRPIEGVGQVRTLDVFTARSVSP